MSTEETEELTLTVEERRWLGSLTRNCPVGGTVKIKSININMVRMGTPSKKRAVLGLREKKVILVEDPPEGIGRPPIWVSIIDDSDSTRESFP